MLRVFGSASPLAAPLRALLMCLGASALVAVGYFVGIEESRVPGLGDDDEVVNTGNEPAWIPDELDFNTFWDVWKLVRANFVDQPVSERDLYYGALQGMLWSLDDPYSTYFTPEEAEAFNQELSGTFFGIGAEIGIKEEQIVVIAPLPETPAEKAGVAAGDAILAIDGAPTVGMTTNDAVILIRGDKGTDVVLTLSRNGGEPFDVTITRDEITVKSVTSEIRSDNVGVIEINVFNDDTVALFDQAAEDMVENGVSSLIIDLRNDPGGLLDAAIDVAGYWIDNQPVVIEEIRGARDEYSAPRGSSILASIETVVIVNGGSASASEILAGALQDYQEAAVIGEQTFGKGSVQEYHELPDGSAVKLTVARWLTPLGRFIDHVGITPDVL
ncbi:MAG: S41 family peptidase, partial [Candidatus Uhrbacteria bacterium]|nr:S41 family peptidase [Candidatus Uhrbacteria bacterium]